MTPIKLLQELEALGATVEIREGVAKCRAPKNRFTDEIRAMWIEHREAITALLLLRAAWPDTYVEPGYTMPKIEFMQLHRNAQDLCHEFLSLSGEPLGMAYPVSRRFDAGAAFRLHSTTDFYLPVVSLDSLSTV